MQGAAADPCIMYFPAHGGWEAFDQHAELSAAIWDGGLSEAEGLWHYMNFCAGSSIWESNVDGSAIVMEYANAGHGTLTELSATPGVAADYLRPIAERFGLRSG